MFPRGTRFPPQNIPDVPEPNAYNLDQGLHEDFCKRGAFLEKAGRFSPTTSSDPPGPGELKAEATSKRPNNSGKDTKSGSHPSTLTDRYATLQRKVDELERLHREDKKLHRAEVERLKADISTCQKTNADQVERMDKQKKQIEGLEARVQNYKKDAAISQAELKELRMKLRMSDHERTQLSSKQGDANEMKRAIQTLELKRREEMRERDRKINELEKLVATEKKKRDIAEARVLELKGKNDEEVKGAHAVSQNLERELKDVRDEVDTAHSRLSTLQRDSEAKEQGLIATLENNRALLARTAEEFGRLASSTVALSTHTQLKSEHVLLQARTLRLERKLANTEEQVVELGSFIRHVKAENSFLTRCLRDAEQQAAATAHERGEGFCQSDIREEVELYAAALDLERGIRESECWKYKTHIDLLSSSCNYYRVAAADVLLQYSIVDKALQEEKSLVHEKISELSNLTSLHDNLIKQVEAATNEREGALRELRSMTACADEAKKTKVDLQKQIASSSALHEETLKKERAIVQRLTTTVQKSRMAEEGLRADIERLTAELADAERYQEAYYNAVDELGSLVARNALAEKEAQWLSKFNAEILGHQNPAQRIMYVDRIRKELAETKHSLLVKTREYETAMGEKESLLHELGMYTSVMVPADSRPRTNITRVGRPALMEQSINVGVSNIVSLEKSRQSQIQILDGIPGDMTLDEIT